MTRTVPMRQWLLGGLLLSLVCISSARAEDHGPSPQELLRRMDAAFVNLSYDGVFSYFSGEDLASLRVVHKVIDGIRRERLVHLNGAPREIVRHGDKVSCIVMPGDDLLAVEKSIPAGPFARAFVRQFDRINDSYMVDNSGEGRVAGRLARRIAVSPKDSHRYGYRLWLDRENSLLLRSELVDHNGEKLEIFMFNQVRFGDDVQPAALETMQVEGSMVSHLTLKSVPLNALSPQAGEPPAGQWRTRWLPPGFAMASDDRRHKPASGEHVTSLMYSDGLAAFSLFIEPMPRRGAARMVSQNGATVAMTHAVESAKGYYLVTLVGEIPLDTAQAIIETVYLKEI